MTQNIVWFDLPALDLERAIRFYTAVLGAPVKREEAGGMTMGMLPTPGGGEFGCIVVVKDFKPSADGVMIYFNVNGRLRSAVEAVRAHGGTVQTEIHPIGPYGFRAEVLDSEGNCVALHSETDA